jgi:hypothetical protein
MKVHTFSGNTNSVLFGTSNNAIPVIVSSKPENPKKNIRVIVAP